MNKELIVYYSRSGANYLDGKVKNLAKGNTEIAAGFLKDLSGADLFRIQPLMDYPDDYYVCIDQARQDLRRNVHPALVNLPDSISSYERIYLGFPNYWGTMPMPVFTFLETYDWHGKVICPFCTHEGSGLGRSGQDLHALCLGALFAPGLAVRGSEVIHGWAVFKKWYYETIDITAKEAGAYV